jgi:hypothetical protein
MARQVAPQDNVVLPSSLNLEIISVNSFYYVCFILDYTDIVFNHQLRKFFAIYQNDFLLLQATYIGDC